MNYDADDEKENMDCDSNFARKKKKKQKQLLIDKNDDDNDDDDDDDNNDVKDDDDDCLFACELEMLKIIDDTID